MSFRRTFFRFYRWAAAAFVVLSPILGLGLYFGGQLDRGSAILTFAVAPLFAAACLGLSFVFERS